MNIGTLIVIVVFLFKNIETSSRRYTVPEMKKAKITGSSSGNPILESYVYNERTRQWDQRNPTIAQPRDQRNNHPNHENKNQIPIRDVTPPNIERDDEILGQHRICESGPHIQHTHRNSQNNNNPPTDPNTPAVRCTRGFIPGITGARIRGLTGNGEVEHFIYNDALGQWVQPTENNNPDRNLEVRPSFRNSHQNPHNNYNPPTVHAIPEVTPPHIHNYYHNIDPQNPIVENTFIARPSAPDHPPPDFHENYQNVYPHHPQYPPHYGGQYGGSGSGHRN